MFDKKSFAQIIKNISDTYDNQREFSKKSEINRTYLSQYMNMKLEDPPKPKTLEKLAKASHGITTYTELMFMCGYIQSDNHFTKSFKQLNSFKNDFQKMYEELNLSENEQKYFRESMKKYLDMIIVQRINRDQALKKIKSQIKKDFEKIQSQNKILEAIKLNINSLVIEADLYNLDEKLINKEKPSLSYVPIVGKIAAGEPMLAEGNIEGYLPVDHNVYGLSTSDDLFYLRVSGNSMDLKVKNGDYALIHKQDYVEDGDIIVAIVNGNNEATLKKYKRLNEQFVLLEPMSSDPTIEAITVDLKTTPLYIIGKAVGQFGKF